MDNNEITNLDREYKRYLQLLRPYLGQLVDEDMIKICEAWIQRLSNCKDSEKALRNKYIFLFCYQLARGVLGYPFLNFPPEELQILSDDINSDDELSEIEYVVIDSNSVESKTKVLFHAKKIVNSETEYIFNEENGMWDVNIDSEKVKAHVQEQELDHNTKKMLCYQCPEVIHDINKTPNEEYQIRANNLVKKLRQMKLQNMLLQKELETLKGEAKCNEDFIENYNAKVDNSTSPFIRSSNSSLTLKSLQYQLQEIKDSRNILIQTISHLQNQLDHFNELKKSEMEDMETKHKLELIKVRSEAIEETKSFYENKLKDSKQNYEDMITKIQENAKNELKNVTHSKEMTIFEKNTLLEAQAKEINTLKNQIEAEKINLQSVLDKITERSSDEVSNESLKIKSNLLEKRLNKVERANVKSVKMYEAKFAQIQREKHLTECSLQLELVRQKAQVVSELTDENQTELSTSLDKLENKYKEIVANVQATAIQRRIQDQRTLEAILQAVAVVDVPNQSHTLSNKLPSHNQTLDSHNVSLTLTRSNKMGNMALINNSFGENSNVPNCCLSGDRMGDLFEKVYIPQRDVSNVETK